MESTQCAAINQLPGQSFHLLHEACPGLIWAGVAGLWDVCSCWHHSDLIILVVCAWCGEVMGYKPGEGVAGASHGICPDCEENLRRPDVR